MKLSTVNSTAHASRNESPTNEIASAQGLQSFLTKSAIASSSNCDRFIKWLPCLKAELFSNQGGQQ